MAPHVRDAMSASACTANRIMTKQNVSWIRSVAPPAERLLLKYSTSAALNADKRWTGGVLRMKLIDADDLLEQMLNHYEVGNRAQNDTMDECCLMVRNAPAADAIPIPCKLGQIIYEVVLLRDKRVSHINQMKVVGIHTGDFPDLRGHKRKSYLVVTHPTSELLGRVPFDKIGKTVFLTKEDAERAAFPCECCFSGTYRNCEGCSYGERKTDGDP